MTASVKQVTVENTSMKVAYPFTPLNETVVHEILQGQAYPVPPLCHGIEIKCVADIGAHVGTAAVWFHHLWPQARVHCFEPCIESIHFLRTNAGFAEIHPYALASQDGEVSLSKSTQGSVLNSIKALNDQAEQVRCKSAAELCELAPDVIKIDTEGCEIEIIDSALAAFRSAKVIYVEYHNWQHRNRIEELIGSSREAKKILFAARVGWTLNRGELAFIDLNAADKDALRRWAI